MARLIPFIKQRANLPVIRVHDDGKLSEPGYGIAVQSASSMKRVSAYGGIKTTPPNGESVGAANMTMRTNRSFGADEFHDKLVKGAATGQAKRGPQAMWTHNKSLRSRAMGRIVCQGHRAMSWHHREVHPGANRTLLEQRFVEVWRLKKNLP